MAETVEFERYGIDINQAYDTGTHEKILQKSIANSVGEIHGKEVDPKEVTPGVNHSIEGDYIEAVIPPDNIIDSIKNTVVGEKDGGAENTVFGNIFRKRKEQQKAA